MMDKVRQEEISVIYLFEGCWVLVASEWSDSGEPRLRGSDGITSYISNMADMVPMTTPETWYSIMSKQLPITKPINCKPMQRIKLQSNSHSQVFCSKNKTHLRFLIGRKLGRMVINFLWVFALGGVSLGKLCCSLWAHQILIPIRPGSAIKHV